VDDDPFSLFGVEPRFDLDPADIRMRVVRTSARLHPDRASDPIEAEELSRKLAAFNAAARVLQDEQQRAEALLQILGGSSPAEDRTLPDGFLEEMLETRMELEEVVQRGDEAALLRLEKWAQQKRTQHISRVGSLFGSTPASASKEDLLAIRHELNVWRYIDRMLEQLHPNESRSLGGID
jgi:curved DNA-binding protein CbpA